MTDQPTCTATITTYQGDVIRCAQPAGHYDEQNEPNFDGDGPLGIGGWHQGHQPRANCPYTWADRAEGATPANAALPAETGQAESRPLGIPLEAARTLHDVLGNLLAAHQEPDDTDLTESDVDQMIADGTPVQIVTGPPPTYAARECRASVSGTCLNESGGDPVCDTDGGECIHAPADLREQYAAALIAQALLGGRPDKKLTETVRANAYARTDAVLAVRDRQLEQLRAQVARVRRLCELTIAGSVRVQAIDQARDTLAALDQDPADD